MAFVFSDMLSETSILRGEGNAGAGVIGTATHDNAVTRREATPQPMPVALFSALGRRLVTHTVSDEQGEWEITDLNPDRYYYAMIIDIENELNGAILDWLKPVVPP